MTKEEAINNLESLYNEIYNEDSDGYIYAEAIDMAIEVLQGKPKGEWLSVEIIDDDSYNGVNEDAAECSICGYVGESYYWARTYYKFCPNCGARMTPYKGGDTE